MPVIDLPREKPIGPSLTTMFLPTYAVMLYPRNEEKRKAWYAAAMAQEYSLLRKAGVPEANLSDFHSWIGDLWDLPLSPQRVYGDGMERVSRAGLAGFQLLFLLRMARHHPRHCKVERAKAVLVEFGDGKASESLVEKAWAEFKSVSHFWTSMISYEKPDPNSLREFEEWFKFLRRAVAYRRAAEATRLLKPGETWITAHDDTLLPLEAAIEPLTAEALAFLDSTFPD
jgi:hypothetical protein